MARLIWRELAVITRTGAWWVSVAVQALLLSAFIVIWGDGVPVWTGTVFEQFTVIQLAFLAIAMPWMASRVVQDDVNRLALLAFVTVEKPFRLIAARAIALAIALAAYVLTALPLALTAMRISSLSPWSLVESLLWPLALCGLVGAMVTALTGLTATGRLAGWLIVSATTLVVVAAAPRGGTGLLVLFVATATMIGMAAMRANRRLRYVEG